VTLDTDKIKKLKLLVHVIKWEDMRVGLFKAPPSDNPAAYPFDISRGIAKTSDEQNNVGETLVE